MILGWIEESKTLYKYKKDRENNRVRVIKCLEILKFKGLFITPVILIYLEKNSNSSTNLISKQEYIGETFYTLFINISFLKWGVKGRYCLVRKNTDKFLDEFVMLSRV